MPSQSLSLAQTQQLQMVLAPQLRQSLEMLQMPVMELRAMVQQELEKNPTIEEIPIDNPKIEIEPDIKDNPREADELEFDKEYQTLAKLDDEWRDYFFQNSHAQEYTQEDAEKRQHMFDSLPEKESLQEHLLNQLNLTGLSELQHQVGELIVGSINDAGFLTMGLQELADSAGFNLEDLEEMLAVIQDFHPTGVGARDLRECLLLQMERFGKEDSLAAGIIRDHLDQLGAKKYQDVARSMGVTLEEVQSAAKEIASLNPRPGSVYSAETAAYVYPEVAVHKEDGEYAVLVNDEQLPRIRISSYYRKLLESKDTDQKTKSYIRDRIRSGAFLVKSIHQRQKTIYRIASEIVKNQIGFFDFGVSRLKPMTMAEVAKAVGVHETTVSRAVSNKYMKTAIGVFELKYFFTPGIKTSDGKELSNKTVKDMIAGMVAVEDPSAPLSDQEIMTKLEEKGLKIARRTVAKYRIALKIPSSHFRKI